LRIPRRSLVHECLGRVSNCHTEGLQRSDGRRWMIWKVLADGTHRRTGVRRSGSSDQFPDHLPMDVGEAEIATRVAEGELLVIETEQMKNCRVQVVYMDFIFDGLKTEFVRGAVDVTAPDAAARHPHGE